MIFIVLIIIILLKYKESFINFKPTLNTQISYSIKNNPYNEVTKDKLQHIFNQIVNKDKNKPILNDMKLIKSSYSYYKGLHKQTVNHLEIKHCINYIITQINNYFIKKHNNDLFTLVNYNLINAYMNNNNDKQYNLNIIISRLHKYFAFYINTNVILYKNRHIKISKLILDSIITQDKISSIKSFNPNKNKNDIFISPLYTSSNNPRDTPKDTSDIKAYSKDNKKIYTNDDYKIKEFKCYLYKQKNANKTLCESNHNFKNKKKRGIWDRPCKVNNECPFYKANKNYKNNFGGCINGSCQLPINMVHLSPHIYSTKYKPFCYNCKNNTNTNTNHCCDEQNDKTKYPNLITPDYAFKDDTIVRTLNINKLNKNGLRFRNIQ